MDQTLSLSHVVLVILRNRKPIAVVVVLATLVAAGVSLILPKWYRATASILPPEISASQAQLIGLRQYAEFVPSLIPAVSSPADVYAAVLESKTVVDAVVDSLKLMEAFNEKKKYKAAKRLRKHMDVEVGFDGLVRLEYEDRDRYRAAAVVNALINQLDRFNRSSRITTARRLKEFIEQRLHDTLGELTIAEENLKRFKERTRAIVISEQTRVSIETAADLFARIAGLEVQLATLRAYATEENPEIRELKSQIKALKRKLAEMGYSTTTVADTSDIFVFPDFSNAPRLEQQLAELTREVEIKTAVYRVLSQQYEQARIQELKDTPTLQVLDWAKPPPVHSRPKRKLIVVVSAAFAFLFSSFIVLKRSGFEKARGVDENLSEISAIIAEDFSRLLKFLRIGRPDKKH